MGLDCIVEDQDVHLPDEAVERSPLLLSRASAAAQPVYLPVPLQDLLLWQYFQRIEEPCPAALAIVMQARPGRAHG
jgi:hypothetical protein